MPKLLNKKEAEKVFLKLQKHYPNASIALNYSIDFELLVAVILSAQTRDEQVNKVTKKLFKKYFSIKDYAKADLKTLQKDINSVGFYKTKAKYIKSSAKKILTEFNGKIPKAMESLVSLPGVARKTANIVLSNAYNIKAGVAVDTHVKRLAQRLGLSKNNNPDKIEKALMDFFPQKHWSKLTYLLIEHGRGICEAKKPKCNDCFLTDLCPSAFKFKHLNK
jgi:endonuclease III